MQCSFIKILRYLTPHFLISSLSLIFLHCKFYVVPHENHYYQEYKSFFLDRHNLEDKIYFLKILVTGATINNKIKKIISNLSSMNPMQKPAVKRFSPGKKSHFCSLDWFSDMFQDYRWRTPNTASTRHQK